jgi:hypothetical protein
MHSHTNSFQKARVLPTDIDLRQASNIPCFSERTDREMLKMVVCGSQKNKSLSQIGTSWIIAADDIIFLRKRAQVRGQKLHSENWPHLRH